MRRSPRRSSGSSSTCRKRDRRIGQAVSVDATMSETNARLHKLGKDGELPKRIGKLSVAAAPRLPTQIVDDIRRAENSETPEAKKLRVSEYLDVTHQVASQVAGGFKVINLKSGAYLIRDPDAGVRAYIRNGKLLKWWVGYFLIQGVDHFTGLPLRAHGFAADENESTHYTTVVEKSIATLGRVPDYITTDRAYYVKDCFEWSVVRGITLVSPYKAVSKGAPKAQATMHCDRHGVPHCRGCGGGTDQVTFFVEAPKGRNGKPRPVLRYTCAAPQEADCVGIQEKSCLVDPMRLLPVWRTHPAYSEARTRHQALERAHTEARSRANAKARYFETRSKRISLRGAVLRMNIYGIIAWLKAALINGWLGTPVLNPELARDADRQRRAGRKTKYEFVQHKVRLQRLRNGDVGGGRVPHRTRGRPPPRRAPTRA